MTNPEKAVNINITSVNNSSGRNEIPKGKSQVEERYWRGMMNERDTNFRLENSNRENETTFSEVPILPEPVY